MLSYQHIFHAGNLADVQKHALLAVMLEYMGQKPKPMSYLETHAARGVYQLDDAAAVKTGEADIVDRGVMLTGGGALLGELDLALREQTGLAVSIADESLNCVAMGTGKALEYEKQLRHAIDYDS